MKPTVLLDQEMFPPFDGFPKEGIRFLKRLKKNNNREWFNNHKSEYEDFVKLPMQSFIASIAAPLAKIAPEIDVNPRRSMFRIYRDTRFSKNKTPYKTHAAAVFHNHRLAQGLLQGFRQKPRRDIGRTANAKGHDRADGPRWPSLRRCWPPGQKRRPKRQSCSA